MEQRHDWEGSAEFLTAKEVGHRLRLPVSTVYYLAKAGELPAIRIGRSWRFPALEMQRLTGRVDQVTIPATTAG